MGHCTSIAVWTSCVDRRDEARGGTSVLQASNGHRPSPSVCDILQHTCLLCPHLILSPLLAVRSRSRDGNGLEPMLVGYCWRSMHWPLRRRGMDTTRYVLIRRRVAPEIGHTMSLLVPMPSTLPPCNMHRARATGRDCEDDTTLVRGHAGVLHLRHVLTRCSGGVYWRRSMQ